MIKNTDNFEINKLVVTIRSHCSSAIRGCHTCSLTLYVACVPSLVSFVIVAVAMLYFWLTKGVGICGRAWKLS